jgi:hypothetical protein
MHASHPTHMEVYEHLPSVPNTPCRSSILGGALCHWSVHRTSKGGSFAGQVGWSQWVVTYLDGVKAAIIQNPWMNEEKAMGHPLTQGLEVRNCLSMRTCGVVGMNEEKS